MQRTVIHMKNYFYLLSLLVFAGLTSCNETSQEASSESKDKSIDLENPEMLKVGNRLFSIPSPVQTAILVQQSGAEYDKNILNDESKFNSYETKTQKGLNLGVYGADLGYVNLYGQTQDAIDYLNAVKALSDDLGVSGAFSEDFILSFQENLGNTDSLLIMVSEAYKMVDQYLQNNQSNDLGGLILAGGWIEALHFSTQAYKISKSEGLKQRIGEQKFSISNLIKMLTTYANSSSEEYKKVINQLIEIEKLYDQVTVNYEYSEPEVIEENRLTIVHNKTEVELDDVLVDQITAKISDLRASIIQ